MTMEKYYAYSIMKLPHKYIYVYTVLGIRKRNMPRVAFLHMVAVVCADWVVVNCGAWQSWYMVGGLRFVYALSGVCMHARWDVIGVYRAWGHG